MRRFVLFLMVLSCCTIGADTLTGLLASYNFNNNANDGSGNGRNATVTGAVAYTDRFGNTQGAYYFDGNDYVATPLYRESYDTFSLSVWFKYTGGTADGYRALVGTNSAGWGAGSQYFFVGKDSGNSNIGVQDQSTYYNNTMAVGTNAWNGSWHHISYTYNNGTGILYFDGSAYGTTTFSRANGQLLIGVEPEGAGYYFVGGIDDVRFYNRALTSTDVMELYTSVPELSSWLMISLAVAFLARMKARGH